MRTPRRPHLPTMGRSGRGRVSVAVTGAVIGLTATSGLAACAAPATRARPATSAAAAAAKARPIYRALGDSYAAGYALSGSAGCARSAEAYPKLLATTTLKKWRLEFRACSGATTASIAATQLGPRDPRVKIVTLSAGGNDIGFGTIATCSPNVAACEAAISAGLALEKSGAITRNLHTLLLQVHRHLPAARIYLLDYPLAIQHSRSIGACDVATQAAIGLFGAQLDELNVGLNAAIHSAVAQVLATDRQHTTNVRVVEVRSVVPVFAGHGMCAAKNWIGRPESSSPLHPTARGQLALAEAVRRLL